MRLRNRMREICTSGSVEARAGNRPGLPDTDAKCGTDEVVDATAIGDRE